MHFVYFSHSYRPEDDELNETFELLMIREGMAASIDPPSDELNLNSAKLERHLRSTDGMVCVLPDRIGGPSRFILYEVSIAIRAKRPVLVFVEDTLPSDIIPSTVMVRRFSRGSLLRQARDHRYALKGLRKYMGKSSAPSYQSSSDQRSCLIIGGSNISNEKHERIREYVFRRKYVPISVSAGNECLSAFSLTEEHIPSAAFAITFVELLSPRGYYSLGAIRETLVPTITLTSDAQYLYNKQVPMEYQPRKIDADSIESIIRSISREMDIFEQDYLDIKDEQQAARYKRYKAIAVGGKGAAGVYGEETRERIINVFMANTNNKIIGNNGTIISESDFKDATVLINSSQQFKTDERVQLESLVNELKEAIKPLGNLRAEDCNRLSKTLVLAVDEASKEKPDREFLKITAEGLKSAANSLKDVAPSVLVIAGKLIHFLLGFGL